MGLRLAYSYYYARAKSTPPDWFSQFTRDYLEDFLPAYVSRYLHADVTIEPAAFAETTPRDSASWLEYFRSLRDQVTSGEDMMMVITDLPYSEVNPGCMCAGENFFLAKPNWGWTTMMNWEEIQGLHREYSRSRYTYDNWLAMQLGAPDNTGINALAVVGHEMIHYVLLRQGGTADSLRIDGGDLSGMTFLDYDLNPVSDVRYIPPNFHFAVQRITPELPCVSNLGGYPCNPDIFGQIFGG